MRWHLPHQHIIASRDDATWKDFNCCWTENTFGLQFMLVVFQLVTSLISPLFSSTNVS